MDFSKNSLRMRLHNIRPFIVPITEFIDIPVVPEISDLPAGWRRVLIYEWGRGDDLAFRLYVYAYNLAI